MRIETSCAAHGCRMRAAVEGPAYRILEDQDPLLLAIGWTTEWTAAGKRYHLCPEHGAPRYCAAVPDPSGDHAQGPRIEYYGPEERAAREGIS